MKRYVIPALLALVLALFVGTGARATSAVTTEATVGTLTVTDSLTVGGVAVVGSSTDYTDWVASTTYGTWLTNTNYHYMIRRQGDTMEVMAQVVLTGTPTTAALTLPVPDGLSADEAKIPSSSDTHIVGTARFIDSSGNDQYGLFMVYYVKSDNQIHILGVTGTSPQDVTQAIPFTWAAGDTISLYYSIPISGW
jgi:hypothetical protein